MALEYHFVPAIKDFFLFLCLPLCPCGSVWQCLKLPHSETNIQNCLLTRIELGQKFYSSITSICTSISTNSSKKCCQQEVSLVFEPLVRSFKLKKIKSPEFHQDLNGNCLWGLNCLDMPHGCVVCLSQYAVWQIEKPEFHNFGGFLNEVYLLHDKYNNYGPTILFYAWKYSIQGYAANICIPIKKN